MCEKCGGTGYIHEQVEKFDRATFRSLFDNMIESFEQARDEFDKAKDDTEAMLFMGGFYLKILQGIENNLKTLMTLSIEEMDKNPELLNRILARVIDREHGN